MSERLANPVRDTHLVNKGDGPMAVRTPPTPADTWVVPTAWWSKTDTFRGRCPMARVAVNVAAAQSISDKLAQSAERIRAILSHPGSHRVLAQRGAWYLSRPGTDPLGAAVCAAIGMDAKLLNADALGRYYHNHADLADYLVATHGWAASPRSATPIPSSPSLPPTTRPPPCGSCSIPIPLRSCPPGFPFCRQKLMMNGMPKIQPRRA